MIAHISFIGIHSPILHPTPVIRSFTVTVGSYPELFSRHVVQGNLEYVCVARLRHICATRRPHCAQMEFSMLFVRELLPILEK